MTGQFLDGMVAKIAGTILGTTIGVGLDPYYDEMRVKRAVKLARMVVEETKRTCPQIPKQPTVAEINTRTMGL